MSDKDTLNIEETLKKRGVEVESIFRLSQIINTGLDRQVLAIVLELLEHRVHPESIADGKCLNYLHFTSSFYYLFR